jgi:hypothetical protein
MQIEVSDVERSLLEEILGQAHQDLKEEIYKTEAHDYHQYLKGREGVLEELLRKLNAATQPYEAKPGTAARHLGFEALDVDNKAIGGG